MNYYLNIDEEGFLASDGKRLDDDKFGAEILKNLFVEGRIYKSKYKDRDCDIHNFDHPLVVQGFEVIEEQVYLQFPYGYKIQQSLNELRLDEWDRFCGYTDKGIAFVFSRKAQAEFFDLLDSFTDDSITFKGHEHHLQSFLPDATDAATAEFWSQKYQNWKQTEEKPGWDLQGPHPAIGDILPQIKINKASIAVLGAGAAHDAALFASKGHIVTAFDISSDAIEKAKSLYPESTNLKYVQLDVLADLPDTYRQQFDLIFEHTFFCAINPADRNKALKAYKNFLHEEGHLLGIFFHITTEPGPPFGATEWELKQRLEKSFSPLYWTRWQNSPKGRQGWELVTYLKKRS